VVSVLVLVLVLVLAWPIGLAIWANGRLRHVDALSGAADTPGTTYLLAGSDERAPGEEDGTAGARADTLMLLQVPESGPAALISIPRDTFVEIPGFSASKINAAYSWGGPALLVATVEQLSGLTVDHFVEVGFGGVEGVVDALGGVELCSDLDVSDPMTGLVWTPGCHMTDGHDALMFARMRYVDPEGDIGRAKRQREVISGITSSAASPSTLVNPGRQVSLIRAGTDAMTLDQGTDVVDLGRLALAFRSATGTGGITGTPPIRSLDYRPGDGIGSTVQLDPDQTPTFFQQVRDGTLPPGVVGGVPS
jgi:LCP family protein required for cell wall assembly